MIRRRSVFRKVFIIGCVLFLLRYGNVFSQPMSMPLLMPDDFSQLEVVAWRVETAQPDAQNPLLEGETPWDRGGVMAHGTVLKDPIDGLFKAWLVCTPAEENLENIASLNHHYRRLCYFESCDGIDWNRPDLPNSAFGEYPASNIVFDDTADGGTQYASVSVDPGNNDWPYEMFVYRNMYGGVRKLKQKGLTNLQHFRSHDGKVWEKIHGPIEGPFKSDVCFVYPAKFLYSEQSEGYVAYYRLQWPDEGAHIPVYESDKPKTRQIFRVESRDGNEWFGAERIMMRDERDHCDTQYMELVPQPMAGGYLGVVTMYHPITQTLNLRMAVSRDGRKWWFPDRRACLDNPPLGDYGGGMIWQSKNLVEDEGRLYVYYAGAEGIHRPIMDTRGKEFKQIGAETVLNERHQSLPFNSALCRASWKKGRFYALASSAGGPTVGQAVTTVRELSGKRLFINFRTRPAKKSMIPGLDEGYLQVELLDASGTPVKGFTRSDCSPLKGDHEALQVKWSSGGIMPPEAVKMKLYLKRSFLYGFAITE